MNIIKKIEAVLAPLPEHDRVLVLTVLCQRAVDRATERNQDFTEKMAEAADKDETT